MTVPKPRTVLEAALRRVAAPESGTGAQDARPGRAEDTRWLLTRPGSLDDGDQARLAAARASCPHLDALARHIRDFADMMIQRRGVPALENWLARAEADYQPELHSLAAGIRRDQDAVTAGLALPYGSGAMEGNVKIKMIRRQMYGSAGFALLRKRVILHPPRNPITKFAEEPSTTRTAASLSIPAAP